MDTASGMVAPAVRALLSNSSVASQGQESLKLLLVFTELSVVGQFEKTDPLAVSASSDSLANRGPLGRRHRARDDFANKLYHRQSYWLFAKSRTNSCSIAPD